MKAEELMLLAAAKGVDLKRVAGGSNKDKGPTVRYRRRSEAELEQARGRPIYETVKGRTTIVHRFPTWSIAELGRAAAEVPRVPWLAACFSFAGDRTPAVYWELHNALTFAAYRLQRRHGWSPQIVGIGGHPRFYLLELAQLVLDEDQHRHLFDSQPKLYAAYLHIEEPVWRHKIFERFDALKLRYLIWLETARGMIQAKLSTNHNDAEAELDEAS